MARPAVLVDDEVAATRRREGACWGEEAALHSRDALELEAAADRSGRERRLEDGVTHHLREG
jgi:hypothetical protein